MKVTLALAACVVVGGGCSIIYNENNIGKPIDAAPDAIDAYVPDSDNVTPPNGSNVGVTLVYPATVDEGRGANGAPPALIVLNGHDFLTLDDGLVATFTLDGSGSDVGSGSAALVVDSLDVGSDHKWIALGVTALVDTSCSEGQHYTFDLTVTEGSGSDAGSVTLGSAFQVICHDELDGPTLGTTAPLSENRLYSEVVLGSGSDIQIPAGAGSAFIYSASTITINGNLRADASGQTAGRGGFDGGGAAAAGQGGACAGAGAALTSGGGGGGFLTSGNPGSSASVAGGSAVGQQQISDLGANHSCGGGGGAGVEGLGGGTGGGGGGSILLKAYGDITISGAGSSGIVSANGGLASNGSGFGGGGGAGGLVVVRTQSGITGLGTVGVVGGAAGTNGGKGADGRVRIDAAKFPTTGPNGGIATTDEGYAPTSGTFFGPMPSFASLVSHEQEVTMSVTAQANLTTEGAVFNQDQNLSPVTFPIAIGTLDPSTTPTAMPVQLTAGYNQVCAFVSSSVPVVALQQIPEIQVNCIEVAFLP